VRKPSRAVTKTVRGRHDRPRIALALDDAKAHLCAPMKPTTRVGRAIASLREVMDDPGLMVKHHPAAAL
jgi:hypothetical protein